MFQVVAKKLKICCAIFYFYFFHIWHIDKKTELPSGFHTFVCWSWFCHRYVNAGLLFRPIEIMNYNNLGSLYLQNAYTSFLSANVTVYTSNC